MKALLHMAQFDIWTFTRSRDYMLVCTSALLAEYQFTVESKVVCIQKCLVHYQFWKCPVFCLHLNKYRFALQHSCCLAITTSTIKKISSQNLSDAFLLAEVTFRVFLTCYMLYIYNFPCDMGFNILYLHTLNELAVNDRLADLSIKMK